MRYKVSVGKIVVINSCYVFLRVIGKCVSNLNCCIQLYCYVIICDIIDFYFNLLYFQVDGDDRIVFYYIDIVGFLVFGVDWLDNCEVWFIYNCFFFLSEISDFVNI